MRRFVILLLLAMFVVGCTSPALSGVPATGQPLATSTATAVIPTFTIAPTLQGKTPTATIFSQLGVAPNQLRGVVIRFMHPWSGATAESAHKIAEEFNEQNIWGVNVEIQAPGSLDALDEAVITVLKSSQDLPHVLVAPTSLLAYYAKLGGTIFTDLTAYLQDPAWGMNAAEQADFHPVFWGSTEKTAGRMLLPVLGDLSFLLYNQSWGQSLGFSRPPATTAEFRQQACAALRANQASGDPDKYGTGGWLLSRDALALYAWLSGFGSTVQTTSGSIRFETPEIQRTFEYLRKLVDDTCAWSGKNLVPYPYFAGRQALFLTSTLPELTSIQKAMNAQKNTDSWITLAYPAESGKSKVTATSHSLAMRRYPKEQRQFELASWLFTRWLLTPIHQARLAESAGMLPARTSAIKLVTESLLKDKAWSQAAALIESARLEPESPSWRYARLVLEDGAWQILQPFTKASDIPLVLQEMDRLTQEMMNRMP